MDEEDKRLKMLLNKINDLQDRQERLQSEMRLVKKEIIDIWHDKNTDTDVAPTNITPTHINPSVSIEEKQSVTVKERRVPPNQQEPSKGIDWEKYIGENIISKIGILILLIGVILGARYSIENNLVSPIVRIILGYITGIVLLVTGIQLREKYNGYSAVLVSGAMATMFFITYAAYTFYDMVPMAVAFGLMVLFTLFTTTASLIYRQEVIALIGLVGAYSVPFLVGSNSGRIDILLSYITVINLGILFISFRKVWKLLYYAAFVASWGIFLRWFAIDYTSADFELAVAFATTFFTSFYFIMLSYQLSKQVKLNAPDLILIVINALIYFVIGYVLLENQKLSKWAGLYAVAHACIHFAVAHTIYKAKLGSKGIFYIVAALVLTFITIAIPIQLDGSWITILWLVEAASLFWIARSQRIRMMEWFAYPLMLLGVGSLVTDWQLAYGNYHQSDYLHTPIWNITFLGSVVSCALIGWMLRVDYKRPYHVYEMIDSSAFWSKAIKVILFITFLGLTYMSLSHEISVHWRSIYASLSVGHTDSTVNIDYRYASTYLHIGESWVWIYTLCFVILLFVVNRWKFDNKLLTRFCIALGALVTVGFVIVGLYQLSLIRSNYLQYENTEMAFGKMVISMRYIAIMAYVLLMWMMLKSRSAAMMSKWIDKALEILVSLSSLWIINSEYLHLMDCFSDNKDYKLGISILTGIYSLLLVSYGIWSQRRHLRITAIVIFALVLIKLFAYDIAHMHTIAKTIIFVSLGVLLLIISFLYNKYTSRIHHEE